MNAGNRVEVVEVSAEQAQAMIESGAMLLDVREPEEWWAGHAPNAVHVPLGELGERLDQLPGDGEIVVVCRSGGRSRLACEALAGVGVRAVNLQGGMHAWQAAGYPVVDDDGGRGAVI